MSPAVESPAVESTRCPRVSIQTASTDGTTAAVGDYAGQAVKGLENMRIALHAAGAGLEDVISTRVLVASHQQADLVSAWNVVRDAFGDHDVPSTLLGVTVLGYDHQLVEVEAVAAVRD